MPAATVARPARAVPDTARRQPQASHIDLTERNQFAVTKPAPHHSSSHATSLDPEDTTTNSRQARSITERQCRYPYLGAADTPAIAQLPAAWALIRVRPEYAGNRQ